MAVVTYFETVTFVTHTCGVCGIQYGMESTFYRRLQQNGNEFFCPNGHGRIFIVGKTDKDLLREEKEKNARIEAQLSVERAKQFKLNETIEKQNRKLRRVQKGICPCCNRTFEDLQRHMKTKHPEKAK